MKCLLVLFAVGVAQGQGTTPKAGPEAYPEHAVVGDHAINGQPVGIGAEFMVHSFSRGEQMFIAADYLVVEVALFPPKGQVVAVDPGKFSLRVNGKKAVLFPQSPSTVAASLTHSEWQQGPRLEGGAGMGGIGVGIGQPRQTTPFPGAPQPPPPHPTGVPDTGNPAGVERERVKPEELVVETALPQGDYKGAVSGFLYFAYKGKVGSIKSLELLYGDAVLKLR